MRDRARIWLRRARWACIPLAFFASAACQPPASAPGTDASADASPWPPDAGVPGPDVGDAGAGVPGPDVGLADSGIYPFPYCYPDNLPTCADGSFRYEDYDCLDQTMCRPTGDGKCYPFCDADGACAGGGTCGTLNLYRCTHDDGFEVHVCFTDPVWEWNHDAARPGPDAAAEDLDAGLSTDR